MLIGIVVGGGIKLGCEFCFWRGILVVGVVVGVLLKKFLLVLDVVVVL